MICYKRSENKFNFHPISSNNNDVSSVGLLSLEAY